MGARAARQNPRVFEEVQAEDWLVDLHAHTRVYETEEPGLMTPRYTARSWSVGVKERANSLIHEIEDLQERLYGLAAELRDLVEALRSDDDQSR